MHCPTPSMPIRCTTALSCRSTTNSVAPACRSASVSPTQTIGVIPALITAAALAATNSSLSPNNSRRSEWPTNAKLTPKSVSMSAAISPVKAPDTASLTFCALTLIRESLASVLSCLATTAMCRLVGQTATSTSGSRLLKSKPASRAAVDSREPCIFQLPITTLRRMVQAPSTHCRLLCLAALNQAPAQVKRAASLPKMRVSCNVSYRLCELFGETRDVRGVLTFDHHTQDRLRARWTQKHPAARA